MDADAPVKGIIIGDIFLFHLRKSAQVWWLPWIKIVVQILLFLFWLFFPLLKGKETKLLYDGIRTLF